MNETNKKPFLSPSQLDTYAKCGEQWRRRYVMKERIPPGVAAIKGTAVHGGAAANWRQKVESRQDLSVSDIKEAAAATFEEAKAGGFLLTKDEESVGLQKTLGQAKDRSVVLAGVFADKVAPLYQPNLVEHRFRIEVPAAPYDIVGVLDMMDDQNRISDLKTSGKKKGQTEADTSVQLTTYAAGGQILTGKAVPDVRLDVLVDTKEAQHQQLISTRGRKDYEALVNRINMVTKGIQSGVFTPAVPGSWWCSPRFCGYWSTCPYVNSERQAAAEKNEA